MTDMERKTFFAALSRYGAQAQIMMVFEEMAELQDVLCKFLRGRVDGDTLANIAEEIADVGIMLDQMAIEFTQKRRSCKRTATAGSPDILPKSGRRSGSTRGGRRGRSSPKCRCQRSRPARPAVSTSRGMRSSCRSSTTRQKATGACTHTASI